MKELEENGIGRPSTYASIIATIEAREYMEKREAKLYPTELGFLVTDLLVEHFQDIMNVEYTAAMEQELDEIEEGKDNLLNTLNQFWKKFEKDLKLASKEMENVKGMEETTDEVCDKCGSPMVIKWGRYGKFLACSNYPECKNTRQMAGGEGADTPELHEDVAKEVCPKDGQPMVLKKGRFGPFLACSNYPECKTTKRLVRGEGGKLQVEQLAPDRREVPRLRQRPDVAPRSLRRLHRVQQLPDLQVHQEEGSPGDRPPLPRVRPGPGGRAQGPLGPLLLRLPALSRVQVHRVPQAHRRALPRLWALLPAREGDQEGGQGRLLRQRGLPLQARSRLSPLAELDGAAP